MIKINGMELRFPCIVVWHDYARCFETEGAFLDAVITKETKKDFRKIGLSKEIEPHWMREASENHPIRFWLWAHYLYPKHWLYRLALADRMVEEDLKKQRSLIERWFNNEL